MASSVPPVRGAAFSFEIGLISQADTAVVRTTPTLAAGDIQVSRDGTQFANLAMFPPSEILLAGGGASGILAVHLTAAEMTADRITVFFHDAAGAEWQDAQVTIYTAAQAADATATAVGAIATTIGVAGAGLTALGDARLANLDAAVSTRTVAGDAMALTGAERTALAGVIWTHAVRTLTSFGTLVTQIATAVWTYVTRTLTSSSTAPTGGLTGSTWTVIRGDTLTRTLSAIAADPTITKAALTVKEFYDDADTKALLMVDSVAGLSRVNGAAPVAGMTGSLTLATGVVTVSAAAMATLGVAPWYYDIQVWRGATVTTIERGSFVVSEDYTRVV